MKKVVCLIVSLLLYTSAWGDFGMFLFRDDSYAAHIESKAGFFTSDQCAEMLKSGKYQEPTLKRKDMSTLQGEVFLVIALRNTGNFGAWGTVSCSVGNNKGDELAIDFLPANSKRPYFFILQKFLDFGDVSGIPQVKVEWVKLYKK